MRALLLLLPLLPAGCRPDIACNPNAEDTCPGGLACDPDTEKCVDEDDLDEGDEGEGDEGEGDEGEGEEGEGEEGEGEEGEGEEGEGELVINTRPILCCNLTETTLSPDGGEVDLALHQDGSPRLVFPDFTFDFELPVASSLVRTDGVWSLEVIDPVLAGGITPRIAIDAIDVPHVAFRRDSASGVAVSRRTGGSWSEPVVANPDAAITFGFIDLVVDAQGRDHVMWLDFLFARSAHSFFDGADFTTETVQEFESQNEAASREIDVVLKDGVFHVLTEDAVFRTWYVRGATGAWGAPEQLPLAHRTLGVALAVGSDGEPRVATSVVDNDAQPTAATLSIWKRTAPGAWDELVVDDNDIAGVAPDLTLNADDQAFLVYARAANADAESYELMFARPDVGDTLRADPIFEGEVSAPHMVLDALGNPHIAYGRRAPDNGFEVAYLE